MRDSDALTEMVDGVSAHSLEASTIPYDIRAEIDWIDFSNTANPLGVPERITQAISRAISEGDLNFLPNRDGSHLSMNLSRYYEISPECFLIGTSASSLISAIAQAYRPCNVGIPTPAPAEYFLAVANVGHNPVRLINPFSLSAIDPALAFKQDMHFDAAVLANPSYPCARLLSKLTFEKYVKVCNWVVVDESSITLTLGGDSFIDLAHKQKNLLVIRSISEDLGMPGIPVSYAVGHPETIKHIRQFVDGTPISMFHEVVAQELPHLGTYHEKTAELLDTEIPWMQCMLSLTPGIKVFPSEANFVMCALEERIARNYGIASAEDLIVRLQKIGFGLRDLAGVPGIEGNRYFLVAIRTHEENVKLIQALRSHIFE